MTQQQQRDRAWLDRALPLFFWSETMIPILAEMKAGWNDGGCYTCAWALDSWMSAASTTIARHVGMSIIGTAPRPVEHVVASITWDRRTWYLDATGVFCGDDEVLTYWSQEEHLVAPFLRQYRNSMRQQGGIPFFHAQAEQVVQQLQQYFGTFSPTWFSSSPESTSSGREESV